MNEADEKFERRAKTLFDESVDGLDAATLSKLNRGRQAAVEAAAASRPHSQWSGWIPATGVAAAVLVAVMVMRAPDGVDPINAPADDLELLLGEASIDMLEELEFYSWIDTLETDDGGDVT